MMGLVADLFDWVVWSLEVGEGGLPLQEETLLAVISVPRIFFVCKNEQNSPHFFGSKTN